MKRLKGETAMKTKGELCALKEEVETLNRELHELTEEEFEQVTGGGSEANMPLCPQCGMEMFQTQEGYLMCIWCGYVQK